MVTSDTAGEIIIAILTETKPELPALTVYYWQIRGIRQQYHLSSLLF